jgi:hypothetical protein
LQCSSPWGLSLQLLLVTSAWGVLCILEGINKFSLCVLSEGGDRF